MIPAVKKLESVRMNCEMSQELNALLSEIAANSQLTISDDMRRAVALVGLAYQAKKNGHRLGAFDYDRKLITEYTNIL